MHLYVCSSVETDYVCLLKSLLSDAGYSAETISLLSEMEYRRDSRRRGWKKFRLRAAMYLGYPIVALAKALAAPRDSVFIVTSNTFYAPFLIAIAALLKRCRVIHLVYDLFPDALEVSATLRVNSLLARFIGAITRTTNRRSSHVVYLGEFLKDHSLVRWESDPSRSLAIHIGADSSLFPDAIQPVRDPCVTLHYGGQLGYMHDADALIASIARLAESRGKPSSDVRIDLLVSGAHASRASAELNFPSVTVGAAVPSAEWRKRIRDFEVGLVSLSPGGATVCLPSKTYSMMAGGLAILAICPVWSDLAQVILEHDAGWVINNSPYSSVEELRGPEYLSRVRERRPTEAIVQDFLAAVQRICADRSELQRKRENARRAVELHYSRTPLMRQWHGLITSFDSAAAAATVEPPILAR